jgi:tetratricopeptide (TPR) repeat protein/aminoglycoside phosphotransferase (APT) family kinase protein
VIGEVLGRYRIDARLGAGGMGEVWRAEDMRLRRPVALKLLKGAASPEESARLLREARLASQLSHPNIAVIYEIDEAEREGRLVPFIAMEFVEGRTLADRIGEGPLPPPEALDVATQVASALEAAHARGVVHRDVKPGNVIVDAAGRVKVLDFGLAAWRAPEAASGVTWTAGPAGPTQSIPGAVVGTVAYMSPEQARGQDVDGRTDVFSLGVVLWEALAARRPFEGANAVETLDRLLHADPPPLVRAAPGISPELEAVVLRMLEKDRERRTPTMREVRQDLEALARGGARPAAMTPGAAAAPANAVAILVFQNITRSPEDDWLGTGIMETVTADLKAVRGLAVIGCERVCEVEKRLTGHAAHGETELAARLGREVGARWVVTGGFQRLGERLRITARASEVETGEVLTTVKVDGEMADLFDLQDRIVARLAEGFHVAARPSSGAGDATHVIDAYEAFSKGLVNLRAETRESVDRAILFFERAVALDPDYARAWLELGVATDTKATYLAMPELLEKALQAFERCLALEPRLPRAWREMGSTLVNLGREERGIEAIRRALELDPEDGSSHAALGRAWFIGKAMFAEAAESFERALQRNPQGGWYALQLAHVAALLRDFPRADRAARQAIELQERGLSGREGVMIVGAYMRLGVARALEGRFEEAVEEYRRELAFLRRVDHALKERAVVELHVHLGSALLALGRAEEGEAALRLALDAFEERLRMGADDPFTRYYVAAAWALLGEKERALDALGRAAAQRHAYTVARARIDPDFDSLRGEAGFRALTGRVAAAGPA